MNGPIRAAIALHIAAISSIPACAAVEGADQRDVSALGRLSLEQLTQIPVRSASKREQPLSTALTSLYVITDEDIARSPATSLPELLREAPNLVVQRIDAREYAITARGFAGYDQANKLLVEIDGRSIYSTLHSGVFWELHNPQLEDIGQIEVISGPGSTLYGANAVNGVISITTRDASDTVGLTASGSAGTKERTAALRYGFNLGSAAAVRVYGTYLDRQGFPQGTYIDYNDGSRAYQTGFRADATTAADHFTVQGDLFRVNTRIIKGDHDIGGNMLARWTRDLGDASSISLQAYYDDYHRQYILVSDALETLDAQAQYNRTAGAHELVAGLGGRTTRDHFTSGLGVFELDPDRKRLWFFNAFVQDQIRATDSLTIAGGLKVERSSFTGIQILPNIRIGWNPAPGNLIWAALSRAVRTPSRADRDLTGLPILAPSPAFDTEKLVALELGYRGQPTATTSLSVSTYLNWYDDLRSTELVNGKLPLQLRNGLKGRSYGVEAWGTQQIASWWRVKAGVSLIEKDFHPKPGVTDVGGLASLGSDPAYSIRFQSSTDIAQRLSVDAGLRIVGALKNKPIPAYREADARVAYKPLPSLELFVAGQNLLHKQHLESNDADQGQAVPRIISAGARIRL